MQDLDSKASTGINPQRTFDTGKSAISEAKSVLANIIWRSSPLPKNTYVYQPLPSGNEIRVLRIKRGKAEDILNCTLTISALASTGHDHSSNNPDILRYIALSYCWGVEDPRNMIMLSNPACTFGSSGSTEEVTGVERGMFHVRSGLYAALKQIRKEDEDKDVWVDAISINQLDEVEKSAQVQRMDMIYTEAEEVWIWLGAGDSETKDTFEFLREISDPKIFDELFESNGHRERWELVVRLTQNSWFSRRWVIQELALAKSARLLWGDQQISWSTFSDAIALFMSKNDEIKQTLSGASHYFGANTLVKATNDLFRKSEEGKIQQRLVTLEALVSCYFLGFEASDPRDTIYAVLSIAKEATSSRYDSTTRTILPIEQDSNGWFGFIWTKLFQYTEALFSWPKTVSLDPQPDPRITPDYNKSLLDVCADFMDYCIQDSHSLDILCRQWAPPRLPKHATNYGRAKPGQLDWDGEIESLPSWVPSIKRYAFGDPQDALNGRMNGDSFVGNLERPNHHYSASAGLWPSVRFGKFAGSATERASNTRVLSGGTIDPLQPGVQTSAQAKRPLSKIFDGTIFIKGFILGEITSVSGTVADGVIPGDALALGGYLIDNQSGNIPEQLWRTLVADRGPNGSGVPIWYRVACRECLQLRDKYGNLNTSKIMRKTGAPRTLVKFLERVQKVVWNRRTFHAQERHEGRGNLLFGLAPRHARQHDLVCLFFGCSVPVLLRKYGESEDDGFRFVGECFVYRYMDGEAIPRDKPTYPYKMFKEFKLR